MTHIYTIRVCSLKFTCFNRASCILSGNPPPEGTEQGKEEWRVGLVEGKMRLSSTVSRFLLLKILFCSSPVLIVDSEIRQDFISLSTTERYQAWPWKRNSLPRAGDRHLHKIGLPCSCRKARRTPSQNYPCKGSSKTARLWKWTLPLRVWNFTWSSFLIMYYPGNGI